MPRRFLHRHQAPAPIARWLKAGVGATVTFALLWLLDVATGTTLIVAPLAASAVLVLGMPESPLSQPAHVVGGHAVAAGLALIADHLLPGGPVTLAATVGVVIAFLGLIRLTHPPAGATALVVMLSHPDWPFLAAPVIAGSLLLVLIAIAVHRLPPRSVYPLPVPEPVRPKRPPDVDGEGDGGSGGEAPDLPASAEGDARLDGVAS